MAKKPLADNETRMARWDQMTPAEKARVRAKEKATLEKAESERERPLSSRVMDSLIATFGQSANAKARAQEAAEDISRRESRYQDAKRAASRSDKDRNQPLNLYGVDRVVKIDGKKKGGAVKGYAKGGSTASKRADGCATKGKTKGRFV